MTEGFRSNLNKVCKLKGLALYEQQKSALFADFYLISFTSLIVSDANLSIHITIEASAAPSYLLPHHPTDQADMQILTTGQQRLSTTYTSKADT